MNDSENDDALRLLMRAVESDEGYEVRTFEMHRKRPDGAMQTLRIELNDAGYGEQFRFNVIATDVDRDLVAMGNPGATLRETLAVVQWHELDL